MGDKKKKAGQHSGELTEIQLQMVLDDITRMRYLEGIPYYRIIETLSKKYKISKSRINMLIQVIKQEIGKVYEENRGNVFEDSVTQLEDLYARCLKEGDLKTSLEVKKELSKLQALYIDKLKIESDGNSIQINYNRPDDN